ncbi:hypothetical protein L596_029015 [Steinernema carpocapsae]|uniref:Ground-like domain-containing protein n=1 Tax=Steinernema carpocapsae TaxID=34508 RepID=A0A4U5LTD6_STECR|nr:hypothetical protein L596_029015 [Steinernema carpocapsae]
MKVLFLLCVLLISEVWTCPGLFGGGGGGGGCCCGGCGRKKRAISEESGIYVGGGALSLEAPLRSENEIPCPQKKWKSLMNQHMKDSADGIQAKYKIQNAMEAEFGERLFVACGEGKPTFLASGDGYCSHGIEEKKISCLVVAMLA